MSCSAGCCSGYELELEEDPEELPEALELPLLLELLLLPELLLFPELLLPVEDSSSSSVLILLFVTAAPLGETTGGTVFD